MAGQPVARTRTHGLQHEAVGTAEARGRQGPAALARWARNWPELAIAAGAAAAYLASVAIDPASLAAGVRLTWWQTGIRDLGTVAVVIGLMIGGRRNLPVVPERYRPSWQHLNRAYLGLLIGFCAFTITDQFELLRQRTPGLDPTIRDVAVFAVGSVALLYGYAHLTAAALSRVKAYSEARRWKAILLDSSAGGVAVVTVTSMLLLRAAAQTGSRAVVIAFFPLTLIQGVVVVASLALVPMARTRGEGETVVALTAALLLGLAAAIYYIAQMLMPEVLPGFPPMAFSALAMGSIGSAAERRHWLRAREAGVLPEPEEVVGATFPMVLALALPVGLLAATALDLPRIELAAAVLGSVTTSGIVLYRLISTLRENRRLIRRADELREIAAALLARATQETERERTELARELHDEILQELSAILLRLSTAEALLAKDNVDLPAGFRQAMASLRDRLDTVRDLMGRLRPSALEQAGLPAAIEELAATCRSRGFEVHYRRPALIALDQETEIAFFRIAQEAIRNAISHSDATRIAIKLESDEGDVVLEVSDDGRGFDPAPDTELLAQGKVGLASIKHRAAIERVRLSVASKRGQGTVVEARLARDD